LGSEKVEGELKRGEYEARSLSRNNPPLEEKLKEVNLTGCQRGTKPLSKNSLPLPGKGGG